MATAAMVMTVGGAVVITLLVLWRKRRHHKKPSEYDTVTSLNYSELTFSCNSREK